jgi:hypothetical protein
MRKSKSFESQSPFSSPVQGTGLKAVLEEPFAKQRASCAVLDPAYFGVLLSAQSM